MGFDIPAPCLPWPGLTEEMMTYYEGIQVGKLFQNVSKLNNDSLSLAKDRLKVWLRLNQFS